MLGAWIDKIISYGSRVCLLRMDKGVMQDLSGVVQAVAQLRENQPVRIIQGDNVPEFDIVLLLALICQGVGTG